MQRLDNTRITTEAKYYFNFTDSKNVLSLYYNRSNSSLYVNGLRINQFKAKDSEIKRFMKITALKSDFHLPKKFVLFASLKAL